MNMKMNMKMPKLSQQAMIVAFAAALPVLASAYKLRVLDAAVLLLSGALAVYNVNCLTSGSCNTWATVVSVSFFIMTIMQLMAPREGLEGEEEPKEEEVLVTDKEEVAEVPVKAEEKPTEPAPTEAKMPAEAKPEKAIAKAAPIITTDEEFELLKAQLMA
jgi:outer membrane biosynthesis protein TonB